MTPTAVLYASLLLARIGAFVAVAPPFAPRAPMTVRAGLVVALTAFYLGSGAAPEWDPTLAGQAVDVPPLRYAIALTREALIGAAMGFAFGLFLLPARVAGEFITQQIGLNGAPLPGPTGTDSAGPLTNTFETVAALLFLVLNGHHIILGALHASFSVLPLGGENIPRTAPMIDGLATAYEMGVLLAAPLGLCMFLLAVTLAVMARAAPQLNIYSVGFTLQVLVVLVGGLFLVPEFVTTLGAIFAQTGEALPKYLGG